MVSPKEKPKESQTEEEAGGADEVRLYELGYHLLSSSSNDSESREREISKIRNMVESHGGFIVSDEVPRPMRLAYPMAKTDANKKVLHQSAHFGWMRFHIIPFEVEKIADELTKDSSVLRFLLIKTFAEKKRDGVRSMPFFASRKQGASATKRPQKRTPEKERLSEEDLDKTIEELIVE